MADKGSKKVIIKKEDLPAFDGERQAYSVRYRVVSADKNRNSHWSPYYSLSKDPAPIVNFSVTVVSNLINMVWEKPSGSEIKVYDVYIKIDQGNWVYTASTGSTQFSTLIPSGSTTVMASVQLPTYPKQHFPSSAIFISEEITIS